MPKDIYSIEISSEQQANFRNILSKNPLIEEIFGKKWINFSIIDNFKDRYRIHPLFWVILTDSEFVEKLKVLRTPYIKFPSLVKHIKQDRENVNDIVSNIDIFYEYKQKHSDIFFQPENPESKKESDIKIIIEGIEYWGEVLTVNLREEDELHDRISNDIRIQFNEKNKSENCVFLCCNNLLRQDILGPLVEFLIGEANSLRLGDDEQIKKEFKFKSAVFCVVTFYKKGPKYKKGYYAACSEPGRFINDSIRIKNKILDKLDKFQFPLSDKIRKFFVLVIKKGFVDIIDVDNALFGEECIEANYFSGAIRETRMRNGVIHDPKRGPLLNKIDFIVIKIGEETHYKVNRNSSVDLEFVKVNF